LERNKTANLQGDRRPSEEDKQQGTAVALQLMQNAKFNWEEVPKRSTRRVGFEVGRQNNTRGSSDVRGEMAREE
jgi:hypothetical protein